MTTTLDFSHVYAGLKDFQLATVEHVTARFYGDDPTDRFLVADEVGLGKTLVARGVIARSVEHHLAAGTGRIDIVYICSNADIARQNVGRLNVLERNDFNLATRITLLPRILRDLQTNRINFVSFTPGTSFDLRSSEGVVEERVLLYHMLRELWGPAVVRAYGNDQRVFAGGSRFDNFYRSVERFADSGGFDQTLAQNFARELERADAYRPAGIPTLEERYEDLRERFLPVRRNSSRTVPDGLRSDRAAFVGDLRELLARTCVEALEPDLVILDEFQRFKHLLDGTDPAADLARQLFDFPDVRVLLLSATPYKMYTLADEADDDHYADFLDTLRFLMRADDVAGFAEHLRRYRRALFDLDGDGLEEARQAKQRIETALREVMARTERLAVSADRSGMLTERPPPALSLDAGDVRRYVALSGLCEDLGVGGSLTHWKATPYPVAFMDGYELDRTLEQRIHDGDADRLRPYLDGAGLTLSRSDVEAYQHLDPANTRLRSLLADVVERGAWRLLWMPPSLSYYRLGGVFAAADLDGFTKRLVFSAWTVVPRVIGALVSYEAERRMMLAAGEEVANTAAARERFTGLLRFQRSDGRLTGMAVFALLYPSPALAELGDPRALAGELGGYTAPVEQDVLLRVVRGRIRQRLHGHLDRAPHSGSEDARWYWAAPLLLDVQRDQEGTTAWFGRDDLAHHFVRQDPEASADTTGESGWRAHVAEAAAFVLGEAAPLGRPPADLVDVLAELALAGPGVAALRALDRVNARGLDDAATREHAGFVAWGVRSLFNLMDATFLLRSEAGGAHREDAYWRLVLRYCLDGCLQAVLDEFVHVVREWRGVTGVEGEALLAPITETVREALTLRTVNYSVRHLAGDGDRIRIDKQRMRGLFALRFGDERSDDGRNVQRSSAVRTAFNSPFRPFVLATTSVGQEGLDFHTYCHAVVHWNLPSNPVDLEQREGRVHRYKGHAVRKNVAADHRAAALGSHPDPWQALFDAAADTRVETDSELVPFWIYARDGGATIERYVPAMPLSGAARKLTHLKRSLAAYRLVFGQPRQEDLVAYLQDRVGPQRLHTLLDDLRIHLTPQALAPARRRRLLEARPVVLPAVEADGEDATGEDASGLTPRQQALRSFWTPVQAEISRRYPGWTRSTTPSKGTWMGLPAGTTGIFYAAAFAGGERLRVELYVDPADHRLRRTAWTLLTQLRPSIEARFGAPLVYEPLPQSRASRIAHYHRGPAAIEHAEQWDGYRRWIVNVLGRFRRAVQPAVDEVIASREG